MDVKEIIGAMTSRSVEDVALVTRAFTFAEKAHAGHTRFSGEPYFTHLAETAKELARLGMGAKTIAAGLLHDTIEDVHISSHTIEKEFGKEVLFLIEGVTKLGKLKYRGAERHRESLRKLLVATSKDIRVLIIKLADRLHNMRTLSHVPAEKRERIALETLEIYAAIAHRLGMGAMRRELEDLAFEYAYPKEFVEVKKMLTEKTAETSERLEKMARELRKELAASGMAHSFHTESRVKGLYSLFCKLKRKDNDINKVYDIAALRIIVPTVADCYRVLGVAHKLWRPLLNKVKDYIAVPKPNGYRSLHTTVFSGDGEIFEIQIRTEEMHREAELGVASHVSYKEGGVDEKDVLPGGTSFDWIRSLIPRLKRASGSLQEKKDAAIPSPKVPAWVERLGEHEEEGEEYETALKSDLFSHRVFVFTPKGDVIDLPANSSPIDFAYAIHSDIGDHAGGAKVNGKLVPLHTALHNGDILEIEVKKGSRPSTKWLDFVKTSLARRHIKVALERLKKR